MRNLSRCRHFRLLACVALAWTVPAAAQGVSGRIAVVDRGETRANDMAQAALWLTGGPTRAVPQRVEVVTDGKQFLPHVTVVPVGSTVIFPNHDPFNHNVFSLSDEGPFDLGLYGRGEGKSVKFEKPGVIRVYCNVHSTMSAIVLVVPTALATQPATDGAFSFPSVPAGTWTLNAWHERAAPYSQSITVKAGGVEGLAIELDARGFTFQPHLNKFGKPYAAGGRRY